MARALIVDGHEIYRAALKDILISSGHFTEVEEADSSGRFISLAMDDEPVALAVIHPESIGLSNDDCVKLAERMLGDARIVLFSDERGDPPSHAGHAGVTVLPRGARRDDVRAAINRMPVVSQHFAEDRATNGPPPRVGSVTRNGESVEISQLLSRRQRQIMAMVAEGLANKEIAHRLGIAEGTVKAHIHAVFRALGVTNRTQAVVRYGPALRACG